MTQDNKNIKYTHQQYRKAGIAHVVTVEKEKYYFRGKYITKSEADKITLDYIKREFHKK